MTLSGGRGIGDELQHYPIGYTGFPNTFDAPDAQHVMYFDGSRANAAALTANDKMGTNVIDKLVLRAKKQLGGVNEGKPVKMEKISIEGGEHFIDMMAPECMYDLRREQGEAGWLALEKAKATAVGAASPLFKMGKSYYNGVLLTELESVVKFDTTTAGGSYGAPAARNLFLGANALCVAHGTKTQRGGVRYELSEADEDYGEEGIIVVRMIAGFSKARFNGMDWGVIANDTAYSVAQ
jgi:N4-gp56 family major capsid protein